MLFIFAPSNKFYPIDRDFLVLLLISTHLFCLYSTYQLSFQRKHFLSSQRRTKCVRSMLQGELCSAVTYSAASGLGSNVSRLPIKQRKGHIRYHSLDFSANRTSTCSSTACHVTTSYSAVYWPFPLLKFAPKRRELILRIRGRPLPSSR